MNSERTSIDASTVLTPADAGWLEGGEGRDPLEVPALTVLSHPDLQRVGERTLLTELQAGREALVSRRQPDFTAPDGGRSTPLADTYLSRSPLSFAAAGPGEVRLDCSGTRTRVLRRGKPVRGEVIFSRAEVRRGVVLELAGRVVLLLHLHRSTGRKEPARFGLVGDSSAIVRVRHDVEHVADLRVPVLLRGETGTGKELVAAAIHQASGRRGQFVAVNLGAVPTSLASSELFGASKGAFTGSVRDQAGYFGRAEGGTLFLDEIGEAPSEVQVMLLRVLETGEVQTVGAQRPRPADVRLIAASDADLEAEVDTGRFRGPLLHRLAGYEIHLPPLRHRRDDIGRLLLHFLRLELKEVGELHHLDPPARGASPWLPAALVARLAEHDWPGNVRQLRNVARHLVIASRGASSLEVGPAIERLLHVETDPADQKPEPEPAAEPEPRPPKRRKPATVTEEELVAALRRNRWDLKATAGDLRVSRTSLYALIEKFPGVRAPGEIAAEEIERAHRECGGDLDAMVERLEVSPRALRRRLNELGLT